MAEETLAPIAPAYDPLLDLVVSNGIIDQQQAEELREEHTNTGHSIRQLLIDNGFVGEDDLLGMMAAYQGCDVVDLAVMSLDTDVIQSIPASVARMYSVLPVYATAGTITLATSNLVDPHVMDELMFVLTKDVQFAMAREKDVADRVKEYYGDESASVSDMLNSLESDLTLDTSLNVDEADDKSLESAASAAPVVRFVNLVLYQAVTDRASDIHFEPFETDFKIRYRVDGALYEMSPPPRRLALPIISRIKVMSGLNIAERRVPQDGRIALTVAGHQVDLRVSCLPTAHGESVVLRVLDRSAVSLDLENVGLPEDVYEILTMDIEKPNGIIVVTGPTGSGKTTTLYACLGQINLPDRKIITVEDPVEYQMSGINQVLVNKDVGLDFSAALRSILRQAPNIVMIGEIRDHETADIAMEAALTGHLVFSTLHTNDAPSAVTRLLDIGVKPFLVASALRAAMAQRLVRAICEKCRAEYVPTERELKMLGALSKNTTTSTMFKGKGCPHCGQGGYKGRKGIFEIFQIDDSIQRLIFDHSPATVLRARAREMGMRTLREDGMLKVASGMTTLEEVLRATMGDAD